VLVASAAAPAAVPADPDVVAPAAVDEPSTATARACANAAPLLVVVVGVSDPMLAWMAAMRWLIDAMPSRLMRCGSSPGVLRSPSAGRGRS